MSFALDPYGSSRDSVAIPTLWLAMVLSLLLHALLLLGWLPRVMTSPIEDPREGKQSGSIAVRIAPPPTPPPGAAPAPPPAPPVRARPDPAAKLAVAKAAPRPPAAPRVLALERPSQPGPAVPPPREAERPPDKGDLSSFVEARRSARQPAPAAPTTPPPGETEQERINRLAAERLGLTRLPTFGTEKERGGGIFQIQRVGYDDAEFFFYGWNKAIRRNSRQMVTVSRGSNPTIELAIVRKMIAIIREYVKEDFTWESVRLHRDVQLSARLSDNAGLEDFMMQEFFSQVRK